jgi:hypothetical protein
MQLARENAADFGWSARNCQPSRQRDFDLGEFVSPIRRSILRSRTREETSSSAVGALNSLMPYDRFYENVKKYNVRDALAKSAHGSSAPGPTDASNA